MDSLYFLHIPKTAGTSLRYWLLGLFSVDAYLECFYLEEIQQLPLEIVTKHHLFSGHFGFDLYHYLPHPPTTITWLREPLAREISQYNYLRYKKDELLKTVNYLDSVQYINTVNNISLVDLCRSEVYLGLYDNFQVRYLAGVAPLGISKDDNTQNRSSGAEVEISLWTRSSRQECNDEMLEIAKNNLLKLMHFGLCERMEESINLLCYRFCLPPSPLNLQLNTTNHLSKAVSSLSAQELDIIRNANRYDQALYEFAVTEFDRRYREMQEACLSYSSNSSKEVDILGCLKQNFFYNRSAIKKKAVEAQFSDAVFSSGWYPREYYEPLKCWLRWAGPEPCSSVYVPLEAGIDYCITFKVLFHLKYETIQSLRLHVKNTTIALTTTQIEEENSHTSYLFTGIIPSELIDPDAYYTEISFLVDQVFPLELPDQTRYVSFATDGFQIQPLTLNDLLKHEIVESLPKSLLDRILTHSSQLDITHEKQERLDLKFADYSLLKGWYQREYYEPLQTWIRWLGPETAASVYVPLRSGINYQISFNVLFCMADDILESLHLHVNGAMIPLREIAAYSKTVKRKLVGIIPSKLIQENTNYTEIVFQVDHTVAMELPNQTRYVSFATDGMMIEPCKNASYESCDPKSL